MQYLIEQIEKKNTFQGTLDDLSTQLKFVGTFGFGITGLYETVQDLLQGRHPTLDEQEIILIFLTALTYLSISVVDDIKKLRDEIKKKGLGEYVRETIETLKDIERVAIKVGEKTGFVIGSLGELLGYIFLLVPILDVVNKLIEQEGFDIVTLGVYLKSIVASIGIFYVKNLFNNLIIKLKSKRNKKRTPEQIEQDILKIEKMENDTLKEHTETKDELRRVLNKWEKDSRVVPPELILDLAIEDPSSGYEYLDWMVTQIKMGFFLGVDLKYITNIINEFHQNKELLTAGRLLRVVGKFKKMFPGPWVWNNNEILEQILEDPSDINNYPGYGQVEQILQMVSFSSGGQVSDKVPRSGSHYLTETNTNQKKGEQATRKVVRDILKILKQDNVEDDFFLLPDYFSGIDGDEYNFGELEFNTYLNILTLETQKEPFIVDASIGGDYYDEINVTISTNPQFNQKDYKNIQMILNDYIRHEIEHIIEYLETGEEGVSPENLSPYEYYTQPHEVRAQKAGFKRRAKLENKPIEDIIYDYLEYRQSMDKLTPEQKKSLIAQLSRA